MLHMFYPRMIKELTLGSVEGFLTAVLAGLVVKLLTGSLGH